MTLRWMTIVLAIAVMAAQSRAAAPASQPGEVTLTGTIKSGGAIVAIYAVDRTLADAQDIAKSPPEDKSHKALFTGTWDAKTSTFSIPHLKTGNTYDVIVQNALGRWEGVDMAYHRVVDPADAVTDEDKKWLRDFVAKEQQFTNKNRVLWMAADHKHATLLVELIRDSDFHSDAGGEMIYRVELWYFENYFGGWAKDRNTEVVLLRWRGTRDKFPAPTWQFVPALGGITIPMDKKIEPLDITLPDKADAKHGTVK